MASEPVIDATGTQPQKRPSPGDIILRLAVVGVVICYFLGAFDTMLWKMGLNFYDCGISIAQSEVYCEGPMSSSKPPGGMSAREWGDAQDSQWIEDLFGE